MINLCKNLKLKREYLYHLFKKKEKKIIFILKNGLFCEVSDIAFEILKCKNVNKKKLSNLSNKYSFQDIEECLKEIEILKQKGLFIYSKKSFSKPVNREQILNHRPAAIVLDVAQVCNLNCKYCYGSDGSYGSKIPFMSEDVAKASIEHLLKRAKGMKKFQITFFGGEPFLNFSLIKYVVNLCKDMGKRDNKKFQFSVTTNATILDDKIIDFLRENRFGIMVSFDGTEKIHNKYRPFKNGKGSFDRVTQNIKKLSKILPLQGRGTVVKEVIDKKTVEGIIKDSESIGIINLALSPVDCSKIGDTYFSLNDNELQKLSRLFEDITEKNFIKLKKGLRQKIIFDPFACLIKTFYEGRLNKYYRCGACFGMATVSTDGNIYPCHRFVGMDNFIIGDVFEGIYSDKIVKFFGEKKQKESC